MSENNNCNIKLISEALDHGFGSHWDRTSESLYFVDVRNSLLYKYMPKSNKTMKCKVGTRDLAFAFPVANQKNTFIAGLGKDIMTFSWSAAKLTSTKISNIKIVASVQRSVNNNRVMISAAGIDPLANIWIASITANDNRGHHEHVEDGQGAIFLLTSKFSLEEKDTGFGAIKAIAWDSKNNKMYLSDAFQSVIFAYDVHNADISDRTIVFDMSQFELEGTPYGLTISDNGHLWITFMQRSDVVQFDPTSSTIIQTIKMPTSQLTSVVFGNSLLDVLYVTTSRQKVQGEHPDHPAGCTCMVENLAVKGLPTPNYVKSK